MPIADKANKAAALARWVKSLRSMRVTKANEAQLEGAFGQLLVDVLGYRLYPAPDANLWFKPPSAHTGLGGTPDLVLGDFADADRPKFVGALELKAPGTNLDKPQTGRADHFTPVEQAFEYGTQLMRARWVLVSDMTAIRLYAVEDAFAYMEFDLSKYTSPATFADLWWLLSYESLVGGTDVSPVAGLLAKSTEQRIELSEGFYQVYSEIRRDVFQAVRDECTAKRIAASRDDLLGAAQRLLDRLLFLYYCEDHPQQLIDRNTIASVTKQAASLPGISTHRVYDYLKALFREVDAGSPPASGLRLNGYNGELFKFHPIIDVIDLPDTLHSKTYSAPAPGGLRRKIEGAWGLHVYDFWIELDEHMLGKIFEESLSDLVDLKAGRPIDLATKMAERKRGGVFYTQDLLADFTAAPALTRILERRSAERGDANDPGTRLQALGSLRIVDLTCGSGAFIVAVYTRMLEELWRLQDLMSGSPSAIDLFAGHERATQGSMLRDCLYGLDQLPQAVDIAKLALWLRSARRDEKVPDLSGNFASCDSLDLPNALATINLVPGDVDLVIGNPPWGGEMDIHSYHAACRFLRVNPNDNWDSWELFLLLGVNALKPGGRLAFVLPDSLGYESKEPVRKFLIENTRIARLHALGPGWFGPAVRMATMVIEVENDTPGLADDITCMLLAGRDRRDAQNGRLPLRQVEAQRSRQVPQGRSATTPDWRIEVFRSRTDDELLSKIGAGSMRLADLCERQRGEELNKAGTYWVCPSCHKPTVPGKKTKGGGYNDKECVACGATMSFGLVPMHKLVENGPAVAGVWDPWLDGDDINHRYCLVVPNKRFRIDLPGWVYKDPVLYRDEKILIRQAGVGLVATIDNTGSRVPQSLYLYRLRPEYRKLGLRHEFLLGALLSRTMAYVVFKRFAEVDPDKAHAKVTHERLAGLPIPLVDLADNAQRTAHDKVVTLVGKLLDGSVKLGSPADWTIELTLRNLWGLTGDEGTYINGEFADLPDGQAIRELFPDGVPGPVRLPGFSHTTLHTAT